jgi:hypothetical protein
MENSYYPVLSQKSPVTIWVEGLAGKWLGNSIHSPNANADPVGEAEFKSAG